MKRLWTWFAALVAVAVMSHAGPAAAQELTVGAYGNVDFEAGRTVPKGGGASTDSTFAIPTLDLFMRGTNGKWSFLAEGLFDIDEGNEFTVDVDRLQVSYEHADWLKFTAGRFHTSFGYYNTAYPHGGAIYLLPIDRPALVDQHDNASILPTTTVGVNVHGRFTRGDHAFAYDVDVSNGRTASSDPVAVGEDLNKSKAYNLRLRYEYNGFIVGGNAAVDWIPPRTTDPVQPERLREQIFGGHLAYVEYPYHVVAEAYSIQHIGAATSTTLAALAEVGYTFNELTPYTRWEYAHFPSGGDAFWASTKQLERGNYQAYSVGVKYMPNENIALKLELEANHAEIDTRYQATTQIAFGF